MIFILLVLLILIIGIASIFIKKMPARRYLIVILSLYILVALWFYGDSQLALKTYGFGIDRDPVYSIFYINCALAVYTLLSIPLIAFKKSRKITGINLAVLVILAFTMYFVAYLA